MTNFTTLMEIAMYSRAIGAINNNQIIKQLRLERDLTQMEMGELIGKSIWTIRKWEQETRPISDDTLCYIWETLKKI